MAVGENLNLNAGLMLLNYTAMPPRLSRHDTPVVVFKDALGNEIVQRCFQSVATISVTLTWPEESVPNGYWEINTDGFQARAVFKPSFVTPAFKSLLAAAIAK